MRQVRYSEQAYQDTWIEWDSGISAPLQILNYLREEYWVHDAHTCGGQTFQFVVRENHTETCWEVTHSWWIEHDPEWCLLNEFDIEQKQSVSFPYPAVNRDWLTLLTRQ